MKESPKIIFAVILAVGGVLWALWSFSHHVAGSSAPSPPHIAPSATVTSLLGNIDFDTSPTDGSVNDDIEHAVKQAEVRLHLFAKSHAGSVRRLDDLVHVFQQNFQGTIAPNFDARCDMMRERGDSWTENQLEGERKSWTTQNELTRNARFAVKQLEVRMLFKKGKRVAITPSDEGFSTLVSHPAVGRFPISNDAEKDYLDVVEIRLPIEKSQVSSTGHGTERPVLVGYQYAWNKKRNEWTPWAICIYSDPNDTHYAIYF